MGENLPCDLDGLRALAAQYYPPGHPIHPALAAVRSPDELRASLLLIRRILQVRV
jgi:hypothetical protein